MARGDTNYRGDNGLTEEPVPHKRLGALTSPARLAAS
jgi:hypothetical protein